ncbi:MAG: hypothetical protein ABIZ80_20060 [Bryobacteraceae bacterium]
MKHSSLPQGGAGNLPAHNRRKAQSTTSGNPSRLLLILLAGAVVLYAAVPRVKRAAVAAVERQFNQSVESLADDPFLLIGQTRGLYLETFGAVFTAEVTLANAPTLTPFNQSITPKQIADVRAKKLARLPVLRHHMQETLLHAASALPEVPAAEQIVISVTLLSRTYEDVHGMPTQILMQGQRSKLVEASLGQIPRDGVIRVQEY